MKPLISLLKKDCSKKCVLVHCTNSQAIKNKKYLIETEKIKCEFCDKELEQIGTYLDNSRFFATWITKGEYERCTCKKSIEYWVKFDKDKLEAEIKEKKVAAEKEYRERLERLMKYSNLGSRFATRTFDTYKITNENKQAFTDCKDYAVNFKSLKKGAGLLLGGNYGAGKTHLAAAIACELMKQGLQPIFGTLITLLGKVKASYNDNYAKENEDTIINRYINCDLLIVDDLGKEKPTEWLLEKLYYIINCRYENEMPIVITSNFSDATLIDRLTVNGNSGTAEAIVSRLFEICQGVDMNKCKDYRRL